MLSLRRLVGIIFVTVCVSILFLVYGFNENNLDEVVFKNNIPKKSNLISGNMSLLSNDNIFYVIGDENQIYNNIIELFDNIELNYNKGTTINTENIKKDSTIIFTSNAISQYVDLKQLDDFVKNGGQAILAAGLPDANMDSYLQPMLGIIEKTIQENYNEFSIKEGFLPFMENEMKYAGYNLSTWINIKNEAKVYISDKTKNVPIVYSNEYGNGEVLVINATFLSDKKSIGILCGALGELFGDFIYPIMGTKSVFLDNFPVTSNTDDGKCMKIYGRTINSLVKDRMWPVFQGIALRNGLKITSSVLVAASNEDSFPELTNNLFYTISKSSMQYDGEVVYAGNFFDEKDVYINNAFCNKFDEIFSNYIVNGFAVQFGVFNDNIYNDIKENFSDINIIRGNITGNEDDTYLCSLGKNDAYYNFPVVSYGDELDNGTMWDISSIVASQGFLSHCFDVNVLMGLEDGSKTWNERIKNIDDIEHRVIKPLEWLDSCTLSENTSYIDGYLNLNYKWEIDNGIMTIMCDNYIENQAFYLRTDKKIDKIDGAKYTKINDFYYLLKINAPVVIVYLDK